MLTLNDGRSELWQWDTGCTLAVDADCSQVHFSNKVFGRSIDVDVVSGAAIIPDVLLQTDKDLNVWAYVGTAENGYTKISKTFKVNRRNKPADYVFTPPDQTTLAELSGRLDRIEETQDPDAIKNAVEGYLKQNPVEVPVQSVNGKTGAVELNAKDVGAIAETELQTAINTALTQAKASGEFDGADGAPGKDGADGQPGENGTDGYSPTANVTQTDNGATITITDKNGTTTATVTNGKDGADGNPGADGSPGKDGADGKSAYQYAQDGGYTGTETEFAEKLSAEIPTVDSTLTQSGQAADAKAVGDQLSALNEANAEQNTEIAKKANDAELAPVAKSGSYNDLTDKPTISVGGSYLPVNSDDYAADANSVTTTQITKTNNVTLNLPNEITREKCGVIQFLAENDSEGNGTQMYWPIDSAYAGRMYIRGHNHRGWTEWKRYATTSEIPTVPTTLPNPNKLILSGAVTAEYDGSSEVSVEIPAGGSEGSGAGAGSMDDFAIIADVTLAEEVKKIYVNTPEDAAGKYSDYFMVLDFVPPTNTPFTKTSFIGFKPSTAGTIGATKIFGVSGEKSSSHSALITRVKYRDGGDDSWFNYPTMLIPTGSEYAPFYWGAGYRLNNKTWEFTCGESYETEIMFGVGTRVRIFARW